MIIVNAAANSHWQGLEGHEHSSSQVQALCMLEVGDSSHSSGTNLIT